MKEVIKAKSKIVLLIMCTMLMVGGITTKVHAKEAVTGTVYDITNTTVNQTDGSISVSQEGGITYVTLNNNIFGMLRFVESGTYVLNANGYTIYPDVTKNAHAIFCQGPDSGLESITVNLTLKGPVLTETAQLTKDFLDLVFPRTDRETALRAELFFAAGRLLHNSIRTQKIADL